MLVESVACRHALDRLRSALTSSSQEKHPTREGIVQWPEPDAVSQRSRSGCGVFRVLGASFLSLLRAPRGGRDQKGAHGARADDLSTRNYAEKIAGAP